MSNGADWLQDPLIIRIGKGSYQYRKLKNLDEKQYELWRIFHYATGLKLGGAKFFCTKAIDTARTSEDLQVFVCILFRANGCLRYPLTRIEHRLCLRFAIETRGCPLEQDKRQVT